MAKKQSPIYLLKANLKLMKVTSAHSELKENEVVVRAEKLSFLVFTNEAEKCILR
jgi:hypothetical protein